MSASEMQVDIQRFKDVPNCAHCCGEAELVVVSASKGTPSYTIECDRCGIQTRTCSNEKEAREAWERRDEKREAMRESIAEDSERDL